MTMTFDLSTSKYNHFIFVSYCTKGVNLVNYHKQFVRYHVHTLLAHDHAWTDAHMQGQPESRTPSNCCRNYTKLKLNW